MTIIRPSKNKNKKSLLLLIIIIFSLASVYIYEYNRLVSFDSRLRSLEKNFAENQIANSELKSQLHQLTAASRLENLIKEKKMVLEQQPQYLTTL